MQHLQNHDLSHAATPCNEYADFFDAENGILRCLLMCAGYVPSGDLNGLPGKSLTHLVGSVQVLYRERIAQ